MNYTLRALALTALLALGTLLQAQDRDFSFSNTAREEGLTIENTTRSALQMRHSLKQMRLVSVSDNGYTGEEIVAGSGIFLPANAGEPNLPATSRFVAIPNGAHAHVVMGYRSMTTIRNVDLMAAAPIPFDTDDTPNTYDKDHSIYDVDAFYPAQPVSVSESFSLRGVEAVALTVIPYQYNPVTKELRVYDDLQFSVEFEGGDGTFGDSRLRSPYWDPILMQNLVNYDQLPSIDYEARMQQWVNSRPVGCEYLIVIPNNEAFRPYANQLKDYRTQQGILTEVKSLSDMGCTTTDQMKTYFHNAYNNWDIPPVAVLLLADHNTNMSQGIPAEYTFHSYDYGNCITDNGYADVTGDNLPEMAFSRLVAANANEAQMMVSKQLEYEYTAPNMSASTYDQPITALGWQTVRWFQICSEVVGGYWRGQGKHPVRINAIYQGDPGNVWSTATNTSTVVNYFGPSGRGYIPATPNELGGWTGGTASQVVQAVNNGCMLLQHRDHGYYQGWGEPDFSRGNVSQMNNVGKLTFVNTINCQTGTFDYDGECLIEAFMRRTYNNQNAGAVGCIGPTQTSYSFVNDAYAWGMYDQFDPQFMPSYGPYAQYSGNWQPAFGNVAGKYFLQQSSWPYNVSNKAITHKMFTAHCDAFLRLYTQVPTAMTVTHPSQISASATTVSVTAPAGAVVALTNNGTIVAVATTTGSSQNISITPQPANSTLTIVATMQDRLRYVGSIQVSSEPSLILQEVSLNDANQNGQLEYGETASFTMSIKNIGSQSSTSGTATLTSASPYVTITNSTATLVGIAPNQSTQLDHAFGITVSNAVPNDTRLDFTLDLVCGGHSWHYNFNFNAYAPYLKIADNITIDDSGSDKGNGNGRLDPGETAQVIFSCSNLGGAAAQSLSATLTTASSYVTIGSPTLNLPNLGSGQSTEVSYTVSVAATMPLGDDAHLTLNLVAGTYTDSHDFSHRVGLEYESFENGLEGWTNDAEHPWTIVSTDPQSGLYCLQSGAIGNSQSSTLSITFDVENATDEIRFFRKVESEQGGDFLRFSIDGQQQQEWSGDMSWREVNFPVTQGEHTFTWSYVKNASGSTGADCAWLDGILFPVRHIAFACNAGPDQDLCLGAIATLDASASGQQTTLWTTSGDGTFGDATALSTTYTPGSHDLESQAVTLTLSITNETGETLSDELTLRYHHDASIVMDDEASICAGSNYTTEALVEEADMSSWTTSGDGQFDDASSLTATYMPGEQDLANGLVTLTLSVTSPYGCEPAQHSIALAIHPIATTEFDAQSCGTYLWNGTTYDQNGDYQQTLSSIYGCDSIVTMHLSIVDSYFASINTEACDQYVWDGEALTENGIYTKTFPSALGCDSVVELHLTINHSSEHFFDTVACDIFVWNTMQCTESGYYEQWLTNAAGCDSVVTCHLTIESVADMKAIEGEAEVDTYLSPATTYVQPGYVSATSYAWSLEPAEAGVIAAEGASASVTWTEGFQGEATLKVDVTNGCGEGSNVIVVNVKNSYGVSERTIDAKLYPNPTSDRVTIEAAQMQRITVMNGLGQVVMDDEMDADTATLQLSHYGAGVYVVRIVTAKGIAVRRVNVK